MKKLKKIISALVIGAMLSFSFALPTSTVHAEYASASVQQSFINAIAPSAVTIAKSHGLFPSVMIAQAILESDWGRSKLSMPPYYNLFGIKGGSDGVVFDTLEDDGTGNYYGIRDSFRRYNSYLESLEDYAKLFRSTPYLTRLYANFVNASTVEDATRALTGTYATDTRYGTKLMNIIIGYNLLKYDGHVDRAPSWHIQEKNDIVYSLYDQVNIRADHSTDSEVLGRAMTGQAFRRLGVTTGWTYIMLDDGRKAYIATEYVSLQKPAEEYIPVDEETSAPSLADNHPGETVTKITVRPTEAKLAPPEPTAPPEPQNQGPSAAEVEAAKKAADAAIAEGPSQAAQNGLLGSRTAGVENQNKVDKTKLEGLLGSNVDLPFASEEVKKDYRQTLQKAVSLYWSGKATQQEVDKVVEKLNQLREQAEEEDAAGLKADNEKVRELVAKGLPVRLQYTKLLIENPAILVVEETKFPFDKQTLESLRARGQRWLSYEMHLKDEESQKLVQPNGEVMLELPLPKGYDANLLEVYFVDAAYRIKRVPFQLTSTSLRIQTEKVEPYLLLERNVELIKARERNTVSAADPDQLGLNVEPATKRLFGWEMLIGLVLTIILHGTYKFLCKRKKQL